MPFSFTDRWQTSLGRLLRPQQEGGLPHRDTDAEYEQFLALCERRDRDLEAYMDAVNKPRGRYRRTGVQIATNAAVTTIGWDTIDSDEAHMLTPTNTTITIPRAGEYALVAQVVLAAVTGNRAFFGFVVASTVTGVPANFRSDFVNEDSSEAATVVPFNAGDTFTTVVFHTTGANINITSGWLHVLRLSDL